MTLTFDLLTLKVVSELRVIWATSVPILVFLGLSVLDLDPMYATDRRQTASSLNAPAYEGRGIINIDVNRLLLASVCGVGLWLGFIVGLAAENVALLYFVVRLDWHDEVNDVSSQVSFSFSL